MAPVRSVVQTLLSPDETPDPRVTAVELRLDLYAGVDVAAFVARSTKPVVACVRRRADGGAFDGPEKARLAVLSGAAAADWVDVESDVPDTAAFTGTKGRIVSRHDRGWPADLDEAFQECLAAPGVVKCVATPPDEASALALLALPTPGLAMGPFGHFTRPWAPWTYCASEPVAEGQPTPAMLFDEFRVTRLSTAPALFGVAGDPIGHSQSPAIHNAAFEAAGRDALYVRFRVSELAPFWDAFRAHGGLGLSITSPLKEQAAAVATDPSPDVVACGAANTLLADGRAFNTDLDAYLKLLPPGGDEALVMGAGGAARTAIVALRRLGYRDVMVWNRTTERAEGLDARVVPSPGRAAVVVNTTPLDPPAAPFVLDLRYGPGRDAGLAFLRIQAQRQSELFARAAAEAGQ